VGAWLDIVIAEGSATVFRWDGTDVKPSFVMKGPSVWWPEALF
jgi:hypothetical protein